MMPAENYDKVWLFGLCNSLILKRQLFIVFIARFVHTLHVFLNTGIL